MLRPPPRIFIAHKDGRPEFQTIINYIKDLRNEGLRIEPIYVDREKYSGDSDITAVVHHSLRQADAAIVIMTADTKIDEVVSPEGVESLVHIPSLNVVYERGYLDALYGSEFSSRTITLRDPRTPKITTIPQIMAYNIESDGEGHLRKIRDFLSSIEGAEKSIPCFDESYRFSLTSSGFGGAGAPLDVMISAMKDDYSRLASSEERVTYLLERAFVLAYLRETRFWVEMFDRVWGEAHDQRNIREVLELCRYIRMYCGAEWRVSIKERGPMPDFLSKAYKVFKMHGERGTSRFLRMLGSNYAGLLELNRNLETHGSLKRQLKSAVKRFTAATDHANAIENADTPLWRGYLWHNLARARIALKEQGEGDHGDCVAAAIEARTYRERWIEMAKELPSQVGDIFMIEYFRSAGLYTKLCNDAAVTEEFLSKRNVWLNENMFDRLKRVHELVGIQGIKDLIAKGN